MSMGGASPSWALATVPASNGESTSTGTVRVEQRAASEPLGDEGGSLATWRERNLLVLALEPTELTVGEACAWLPRDVW